jgi:hypothetical protein
MRTRFIVHAAVITALFGLFLGASVRAADIQEPDMGAQKDVSAAKQQLILWTSGDREVALKMVFMYAFNCKKYAWMDNIRLLVWGPSAKLLSEDQELQARLKDLKEAGVELYACKGCADMYGISEKLSSLGVNVMYTGKMLADLQQHGWYVLTI